MMAVVMTLALLLRTGFMGLGRVNLRFRERRSALVDAELNLGSLVVRPGAQAGLGEQGRTDGIEAAVDIAPNTFDLLDTKVGDMVEIPAETFVG